MLTLDGFGDVAQALGIVLGGVLAAMGAMLGAWMSGRHQSELEERKWLRQREDALVETVRSDIRQLALKMGAAAHSMCWITWLAVETDLSVDDAKARFADYDREMHLLLPEIMGLMPALSTLEPKLFEELDQLAHMIFSLDARVAKAGSMFKQNPPLPQWVGDLPQLQKESAMLVSQLPRKVADIVNKVIAERTSKADLLYSARRKK